MTRRCFSTLGVLAVLTLPVAVGRGAAQSDNMPVYNVLVFYSSYKGLTPFQNFDEQFTSSLRSDTSFHAEIFPEYLDTIRFSNPNFEAASEEYIREKYSDIKIDLVVGVSSTAIIFASKVRDRLFPTTPLVFGAVDRRVREKLQLGGNVTGVDSLVDVHGTLDVALAMCPGTKHVAIVVGTSDREKPWRERFLAAVHDANPNLDAIDLTGLTVSELRERISTLPAESVVIWGTLYRDGAGSTFGPREVLSSLSGVANAPIFGMSEGDLGTGIVAGSFLSFSRQGLQTSVLARRVLMGERAADIPVVHDEAHTVDVDWNALRRWGLDERRIPPGATVYFKQPTAWEQYRGYLAGGTALILIEAILIVALFVQRSRRLRAQRALNERFRVERLIADLSARLSDLPPEDVDAMIDEGLESIRVLFDADRVSLVQYGHDKALSRVRHSSTAPGTIPLPEEFDATKYPELLDRLERKKIVHVSRLDDIRTEMPLTRAALDASGVSSLVAVPVQAAGTALGVVTIAWVREPLAWHEEVVPRLGLLADIFANALVRGRAAEELRKSEAMSVAVLGSIGAQVCVVDRESTIVAVNEAWDRQSRQLGVDPVLALVGANYLVVCDTAAQQGDRDASRVGDGIRRVLDGGAPHFSMEYQAASATHDAWFELTVETLHLPEGGAVVSHQNITSRKRAELELEQRRQELAHFSRVSTMGELAASLAHELNQPLTGVLTNAQAAVRFLALDPPNLGEVHEILKDIIEDDRRAGEVIRRLRAMLQQGRIEATDVDVNQVAGEVIRLVASDAIIRNVDISPELNPNLPSIHGDRIQLQQVILNLVVNAMDAMKTTEAHERRVTIRTMRTDPVSVSLSVSDTGPGIDTDRLGKVFQPFFTTKADGLGMGLSIARTIVEAHGGILWATNNPDRGAAFLVRLPVSAEAN